MVKLFQCGFLNVKTTPVNIRWLNFYFQPNVKVETKLVHRHWIDVILSMLFQRCFINVETTSINICRLNFYFQPNLNVETTLVYRRWIDVILSTLFQRCFANVETTWINVRRLNFHFQANIKVETTLMTINVVSMLIQCWWACWVLTNQKQDSGLQQVGGLVMRNISGFFAYSESLSISKPCWIQ